MQTRNPKYCPVVRALDIIGDSWTILILRDLFLDGARKFQDFQESLSDVERRWLRQTRPKEARHWNLLTDLKAQLLPYAA